MVLMPYAASSGPMLLCIRFDGGSQPERDSESSSATSPAPSDTRAVEDNEAAKRAGRKARQRAAGGLDSSGIGKSELEKLRQQRANECQFALSTGNEHIIPAIGSGYIEEGKFPRRSLDLEKTDVRDINNARVPLNAPNYICELAEREAAAMGWTM
ncbi:hypothetical protein DPMN_180811 [Dreissena polymorpha]|uniref:Uncharacterized protein n=1 Tax=Dreissena polymorpha TaxID=45954 RepID=A0A9D4DF07_DREPO|nr:hypothetical protein DPMN_180811 [Dreissena polymorpha]